MKLSKKVLKKIRRFIRVSKDLASFLRDNQREDFEREVEGVVATLVAYLVNDPVEIMVDIENEEVIINDRGAHKCTRK